MKLVQLLLDVEGINADDITEHIGKSKPTVERYLRIARDIKMIEFRGAPKTGGYYITSKMKKMIK